MCLARTQALIYGLAELERERIRSNLPSPWTLGGDFFGKLFFILATSTLGLRGYTITFTLTER